MRRKPTPRFAHWHSCGFCKKRLPTAKGIRLHVQNTPRCRKKWEKLILRPYAQTTRSANHTLDEEAHREFFEDIPIPDGVDHDIDMEDHSGHRTRVEDVPEEEEVARRYVEDYPGIVAEIIKKEKTLFEQWLEAREHLRVDEWAPFEDEEEWELFRWLIKHVGQNNIDEFLKLAVVRTHLRAPATSRYAHCWSLDQESLRTVSYEQIQVFQASRRPTNWSEVGL